ncbi:MAG TPA: hypothetical protein VNL77_20190 [Roseiflexaceae bacterium]|nr:hypothetical protein [Roseiflexaceae bacterium]
MTITLPDETRLKALLKEALKRLGDRMQVQPAAPSPSVASNNRLANGVKIVYHRLPGSSFL